MTLTRRRLISISAGIAGLGAAGALARVSKTRTVIHEWRGIALGAETSIKLAHEDHKTATWVLARCRSEIERLEDIFSLYRPSSEISRLNRDGRLNAPSSDLKRCLEEAHLVSELTGGAFDVTVAPLWDLRASIVEDSEREIQKALERIDYNALLVEPDHIAFASQGMGLTLNGIAQGYITDRIAELLGDLGFARVLVSLGETRALEAPDERAPWRIEIDGSGTVGPTVTLENAAIATSSKTGLNMGPSGDTSHLIDPRTGEGPSVWQQVSVIAPTATRADALSTGLSFIKRPGWADILSRAGAQFAIGRATDGTWLRLEPSDRWSY